MAGKNGFDEQMDATSPGEYADAHFTEISPKEDKVTVVSKGKQDGLAESGGTIVEETIQS